MSDHVPDRHSARIERQDRRDQQKTVKARQKELEEKHGKSTDTVNDDRPEAGEEETITVSGADCPDCTGVIVVVSRPNQYPSFEEKCTGGCDR